jgi:hypothetical protein
LHSVQAILEAGMSDDLAGAFIIRFYLLFFTVPVVLALLGRVVTDAAAQRNIILGTLLVTVVYLVFGWPRGDRIRRTLRGPRGDT